MNVFLLYSVWVVLVLKVFFNFVFVYEILSKVGWINERIFVKFYNKLIVFVEIDFVKSVMIK